MSKICTQCETRDTPLWRNVQGNRMCNKCGIKLIRQMKRGIEVTIHKKKMYERVESKRYNLKSLTKEFGEILQKVDTKEVIKVVTKCFDKKTIEEYKSGKSVEISVLNITLDCWRELRGLTE